VSAVGGQTVRRYRRQTRHPVRAVASLQRKSHAADRTCPWQKIERAQLLDEIEHAQLLKKRCRRRLRPSRCEQADEAAENI